MSRCCRWFLLLLSLPAACFAGDDHPWTNLGSLRPGDRIRVSLATAKPIVGVFESWTPERIAFTTDERGRLEANREDVRRIDRFRSGTWTRKKSALVGAGLGSAGGFAAGTAAGGCHRGNVVCFSRPAVGGMLGAFGFLVGAGVGAAIPHHTADLLYRRP